MTFYLERLTVFCVSPCTKLMVQREDPARRIRNEMKPRHAVVASSTMMTGSNTSPQSTAVLPCATASPAVLASATAVAAQATSVSLRLAGVEDAGLRVARTGTAPRCRSRDQSRTSRNRRHPLPTCRFPLCVAKLRLPGSGASDFGESDPRLARAGLTPRRGPFAKSRQPRRCRPLPPAGWFALCAAAPRPSGPAASSPGKSNTRLARPESRQARGLRDPQAACWAPLERIARGCRGAVRRGGHAPPLPWCGSAWRTRLFHRDGACGGGGRRRDCAASPRRDPPELAGCPRRRLRRIRAWLGDESGDGALLKTIHPPEFRLDR